jgi:hypothetical protein
VYVLTSGPLPAGTPGNVIAAQDGPDALVKQLRSRGSDGDVHLVGGLRTIRAFHEPGALDRPFPFGCCKRTGRSPTGRPSSSTRYAINDGQNAVTGSPWISR